MAMTVDDLIERVEYWRARVCPEWRVGVTDEDPEDVDGDADRWLACTSNDLSIAEIVIHYRLALLKHGKKEIDRILVHELIHPLLDRVLDHDRALTPCIGPVQWEIYKEARRDDMEEFVNRMAHCIVSGDLQTGTTRLASHS